jgi:DNA-binding PadR family transcriptional regulator
VSQHLRVLKDAGLVTERRDGTRRLYRVDPDGVAELRDYFERLRNVRLEIGGADLIALGLPESPQIGEILAEIRKRKLNGELDGREAELAAARELVAASVAA